MSGDGKVHRPDRPGERIKIRDVVHWQGIRSGHDEYAVDPKHMFLHLMKCLGMVAARLEHEDHEEPFEDLPDFRKADIVICSIWLIAAFGDDVPLLVSNRIWDIGIGPVRSELPPAVREMFPEEP